MSQTDLNEIKATIQLYLDGTREGNVQKVKQAFHPQARMSGYLQGNALVGGPEPFFDVVQSAPAPATSGEPYRAEIVRLDVAGPVASATVEEGPYLGMQFTTFFHLIRVEDRWQIVSKTFRHH